MNRALSMISLATKAGKTKSGEFMTEKEVKEGRAHLVITQRRNFRTCVIFIKCQYTFLKIKIPWAMRWEKSSVLRLQ